MIDIAELYNQLKVHNMDMFCGVPDSLLKNFCAYITDHSSCERNIIAANEGNAIAIAAGHYLATGNPAVVYMQNSGLGNIVNPLLSLIDEEVYLIPVLLIIGWRGEPGVHDEPQHIKQGKLTIPLLKTMGIRYEIFENLSQLEKALAYLKETNKPFAFIVRKNTFEQYDYQNKNNKASLMREEAIKAIVALLENKDIVVSTTGMISRELYEARRSHEKDFLTVGSMGHASSIALGIALEKKYRKVFCLDGDGAFLMHMGASAVIASCQPKNYRHIVLNNEAHDSVGAQPTVMRSTDLVGVSKSVGYSKVFSVSSLEELKHIWNDFYNTEGPCMLEVKVKCGARKDLGRPKEKPIENKLAFMNFVRN